MIVVTKSKIEEYLFIQGRGDYCSKLKTENLKTKKFLKINVLDKQEPSVQSADKTKAFHVWSYLLKAGD